MTQKLNMTAPFAKVNSTDDGGREVWGFATLERVDKSGEIADFDGTVKAFQTWASDTEKRTGGKSKGNVRLMHQPIVVGKMIHWEPTETEIDGEVYKGIWVGAYIPPTKPDVIKDIDEGILSGISIGGSYEKRWYDDAKKAFRFIPALAEWSLVDNPCVPGADITQVIQKAVVPSVTYEFDEKESEPSVKAEDVAKAAEAAGITLDQAKSLFEHLSKAQDTPPAPESVDVVDGDGDKDDNKEFPNPPSGDEKVNIAEGESEVKDNEEAVGVAEKSAESTEVAKDGVDVEDEPQGDPEDEDDEKCMGKAIELLQSVHGKLEKAGKAISAKNAEHLHKAIGHVTAALSGNHGYTCGASGQGNTGEEAPEVTAKALVGEMQKSVQAEVFELTNKVESLVKGLASHDALTKAFEPLAKSVEAITTRLGDMEKMVKEIHETPLPTGVALNGGSPDVAKMFAKGNFAEMANTSDDVILDFIKSVNDPQVRAKLGEELALRQMKQSLSNPTIR